MVGRVLSTGVVIVVLFFSLQARAQLSISGPGIPPEPAVLVIVNPPDRVRDLLYTYQNTGAVPIDVTPTLVCPPDTLKATIASAPFTLLPNETRQVGASLQDLEGGAGAGASVTCTINGVAITVNIIPPPPARSLLKIDISLRPQTTSAEAVQFDIDFETNLDLNIDINGILVRSDTGLGVTGTEFQIFELSTTFGLLSLFNQLVFSTPFALPGTPIGPLLFVRKQVTASLTIGGITIRNDAFFEDVNFPPPFSFLTSYQAANQVFRFGNVLTLSGALTDGASMTLITGLCADPQRFRLIKKRAFLGTVCPNEKLEFTVEKILINNLTLGPLSVSSETEFRHTQPIQERLTLSFGLAELGQVTARLSFTDITALNFQGAQVSLSAPGLTIQVVFNSLLQVSQLGGTLTLSLDSATLQTTMQLFPLANFRTLFTILIVPIDNSTQLQVFTLFMGTATFEFQSIRVSFNTTQGIFNLSIGSTITRTGLSGAVLSFGIRF